jgi:hypothetical protein
VAALEQLTLAGKLLAKVEAAQFELAHLSVALNNLFLHHNIADSISLARLVSLSSCPIRPARSRMN